MLRVASLAAAWTMGNLMRGPFEVANRAAIQTACERVRCIQIIGCMTAHGASSSSILRDPARRGQTHSREH
jgi:hypothetical protein